jgi:hypothetical protein
MQIYLDEAKNSFGVSSRLDLVTLLGAISITSSDRQEYTCH